VLGCIEWAKLHVKEGRCGGRGGWRKVWLWCVVD
jgi:hypothetical protein